MSKASPMAPEGSSQSVRLSMSIPSADYRDLKAAAERQRVSVARVTREAVRKYLSAARRAARRTR